jgi:hypothetical protein
MRKIVIQNRLSQPAHVCGCEQAKQAKFEYIAQVSRTLGAESKSEAALRVKNPHFIQKKTKHRN